MQRKNVGEVDLRPPTYGSARKIYRADGLADIVTAQIARLRGRGAQRWLFRGANGNPPHQNTVGYRWRKTRRDAGHPTIKLHDLGHFYASGLMRRGAMW